MKKAILICALIFASISCKKDSPGCWTCNYGSFSDDVCGDSEDDARSKVAINGVINPPKDVFREHCKRK